MAPAIHLFRLQVASVFEQLHVVEEEADHPLGFLQIGLHLRCMLSRSPRAHHPHVLQHTHTHRDTHKDTHTHGLQHCVWPQSFLGQISLFWWRMKLSWCLTVCSSVSTWLSCSSHTPDSIWTLLTTLCSRSSLHRQRGGGGGGQRSDIFSHTESPDEINQSRTVSLKLNRWI